MKTVSIIIPTYNRKELVLSCIDSINQQDYAYKELIIVDDGSTDGTAEEIAHLHPKAVIIRNDHPMGPPYARNRGIKAAKGAFVYFLDSDAALVSPSTISTMVSIMENNSRIGMLGGIGQLNERGEVQSVYGKRITFDGRSYPVFLDKDDEGVTAETLAECDYVETCNCFVRAEAARKCGGFDPYYIYMAEDKEFGFRIGRLGYICCFALNIACLHQFDHAVTFDRRYMYIRAKMSYMIKNASVAFALLTPLLDFYMFFIYYPALFLLKRLIPSLRKKDIFRNTVSPNAKAPPLRWVLLVPFLFLKAYLYNYVHLFSILKNRNRDFLSDESMEEFARFQSKSCHA